MSSIHLNEGRKNNSDKKCSESWCKAIIICDEKNCVNDIALAGYPESWKLAQLLHNFLWYFYFYFCKGQIFIFLCPVGFVSKKYK